MEKSKFWIFSHLSVVAAQSNVIIVCKLWNQSNFSLPITQLFFVQSSKSCSVLESVFQGLFTNGDIKGWKSISLSMHHPLINGKKNYF